MRVFASLLLGCSALGFLACASTDPKALALQNAADTSTPAGRDYEIAATRAFWGDVAFMRVCAPAGTPVRDPLTLYLRIRTDGSVRHVIVTPDSSTTECIKRATSTRTLPRPPAGTFVAKIQLSFTE